MTITEGLWSSLNDLLDVHAGVLLVNLQLEHICHAVAIRAATLPVGHPICTMVQKYSTTPEKTHLPPLQKLIEYFKMKP